jgi:hypothetical protein
MGKHVASVLGLAYESSLTQFTVRTGPGTSFNRAAFKAQKESQNLPILTIQPDMNEAKSDFGRVYQWFKLEFPDGNEGWLRGHVVGIHGDFNEYGYGFIPEVMHAYLLERDPTKTGPVAEEDTPVDTRLDDPQETPPTKDVVSEDDEQEESEPMSLFKAALLSGEASVSGPQNTTPTTPVSIDGESGEEIVVEEPVVEAPAIATTKVQRPTTPAMAIIKTKNVAHTRVGPSTVGSNRKFTVPRLAPVQILAVQQENRAQHYKWYRINYRGQEAWIRADLVRYEGDTSPFGLPWDLYPAPMRDNSWWVRGFNRSPNIDTSTWEHKGWDMGANTGEPIYCGPYGGQVVNVLDCTKCTPGAPNTLSHGLRLGDSSVYSDIGWGFGYGTFIIVGYHHDNLPDSTQKVLADKGFAGGSLYALYAHLQRRVVNQGDDLAPNTIIGFAGNTGNSEATHLHLEVRVGRSANFPGWATLGSQNLVNPSVLFNR